MSEPTPIGDLIGGKGEPSQHAADANQSCPRVALPRCANEKEFRDKVLGCLEPWFKIDREVTGLHPDGRRLRIDAVLAPLEPAGWLDPDPAVGVEFKQPGEQTRDRMRLAAQAVDYTFVNWSGYGRLGVFLCTPGKGAFPPHGGWRDPNFVIAHLLGQFAVGELCYLGGWALPFYPIHGWALLIHGHHRLWSEGHGVQEAATRTIRPKVGSR